MGGRDHRVRRQDAGADRRRDRPAINPVAAHPIARLAAPGAFSSAGDGFETSQRGVSPTIPFSLLDDSTSIFPGDTLGIIGEAKTDRWFGVTDTDNTDNPGGAFRAEWTFRVAGYGNLEVDIDMGAFARRRRRPTA